MLVLVEGLRRERGRSAGSEGRSGDGDGVKVDGCGRRGGIDDAATDDRGGDAALSDQRRTAVFDWRPAAPGQVTPRRGEDRHRRPHGAALPSARRRRRRGAGPGDDSSSTKRSRDSGGGTGRSTSTERRLEADDSERLRDRTRRASRRSDAARGRWRDVDVRRRGRGPARRGRRLHATAG